jgi:hypothetical protein
MILKFGCMCSHIQFIMQAVTKLDYNTLGSDGLGVLRYGDTFKHIPVVVLVFEFIRFPPAADLYAMKQYLILL